MPALQFFREQLQVAAQQLAATVATRVQSLTDSFIAQGKCDLSEQELLLFLRHLCKDQR